MEAGRTDVSVHWEILRSVSPTLTSSLNIRNPDSLDDSSVQSRKTEFWVASAVVITGAGGGGLEGMRSMGEIGSTGSPTVLPSLKYDDPEVLPSHPEMRRDADTTTKIKMRIKLIDCFLMIFITITSFDKLLLSF